MIAKVEKAARPEGLKITADMYTYTAGATGLDAAMPPWVLDGGYDEAFKRLADPDTAQEDRGARSERRRTDWENLYLAAGSPDRVLLVGFKSDALKPLTGKTLAEVAKLRGEDPVDTIMNLVLEDRSRVGTVYFMMSEENIRQADRAAWVSFGSDAASMAPEPPFTKSATHPRAYGNFARLLGKYVRDEKVIPLARGDAPAHRTAGDQPRARSARLPSRRHVRRRRGLRSRRRSPIAPPSRSRTSYAVGMRHVFVNGVQVLANGEHTGAKPGRALWGPGRTATK